MNKYYSPENDISIIILWHVMDTPVTESVWLVNGVFEDDDDEQGHIIEFLEEYDAHKIIGPTSPEIGDIVAKNIVNTLLHMGYSVRLEELPDD